MTLLAVSNCNEMSQLRKDGIENMYLESFRLDAGRIHWKFYEDLIHPNWPDIYSDSHQLDPNICIYNIKHMR